MCCIRVPCTAIPKWSDCHCELLHVALSGLHLVTDRLDVKVQSPVELDLICMKLMCVDALQPVAHCP